MTKTRSIIDSYIEMTKPRIVQMVLVTSAIGYLLGGRGIQSWATLILMLLGTCMAAAGSAVLNNYLERDLDARMKRTANRPIPSGRISPASALSFGVFLVLGGVALLAWQVNHLTALLVLMTAFLYDVVYTPLKRVTWLNTSVGAIPGAIPPMSGWTAATGELEWGALALFLILFAWQHPHFYAIAWMSREDYARAGFKMLSVVDPSGRRISFHSIVFSLVLMLVSIFPVLLGITGSIYLIGAVLAGSAMLAASLFLANTKEVQDARCLLRVSVIYLPVLLILIVTDGVF